MASTDKYPTMPPGAWDSAKHMAPDPSLPVEAQLQWYKVASHVLLLNCSEMVRRSAAVEADKALAMRAGTTAYQVKCPACGADTTLAGAKIASHAAKSGVPCVASEWTWKGAPQA